MRTGASGPYSTSAESKVLYNVIFRGRGACERVSRGELYVHNCSFKQELIAQLPGLRAFARTLTKDPVAADDLVQDTCIKAWEAQIGFMPGTNMRAWLFAIMRNAFRSQLRRQQLRTTTPLEDVDEAALAVPESQFHHLRFNEVRHAFGMLVPQQQEAIRLVAIDGRSYEEVAALQGCAPGTIKSRVSRGRAELRSLCA